MKQSLVALAILGAFTGVVSAATNVTLYGQIEVGYEDLFGRGEFSNGATPDVTGLSPMQAAVKRATLSNAQGLLAKSVVQYPRRTDRFGIMGEEDLGNGVSAIFKLEANFKGDTGDAASGGQLFNRESTVGLKGKFGEVKIGRAKSQVELATGGLLGTHGVTDVDLYAISSTRHSNGLFYEYKNSGFTVGADVTTKGGGWGNDSEGTDGSKIGYGARLGYYGNGLLARIAYQNDGPVVASPVPSAIGKKQHEWAGVLAYNFYEGQKIPLAIGVSYAQGKGMAQGFFSATKLSSVDTVYAKKASTLGAIVRTWFSPNDTAYVLYQKRKSTAESGATLNNAWALGLGYEHKLSKRTAVAIDTVYLKAKNVGVASPYGFVGFPVSAKAYGYSVGLSHSF